MTTHIYRVHVNVVGVDAIDTSVCDAMCPIYPTTRVAGGHCHRVQAGGGGGGQAVMSSGAAACSMRCSIVSLSLSLCVCVCVCVE